MTLAPQKREYRLAVSVVRVYGERLHWPHITSTGLCFGAFGLHCKARTLTTLKEPHGTAAIIR